MGIEACTCPNQSINVQNSFLIFGTGTMRIKDKTTCHGWFHLHLVLHSGMQLAGSRTGMKRHESVGVLTEYTGQDVVDARRHSRHQAMKRSKTMSWESPVLEGWLETLEKR